jgi:phasin family protein
VARRNREIMQQSLAELSQSMQALASPEGPQSKAAKQADLLKATYERAVANMKEISDLIQRSNSEAIGLINDRFAEAMDEVKALVAKSASSPPR